MVTVPASQTRIPGGAMLIWPTRWYLNKTMSIFCGIIQYIQKNMHTVFALLCFVVVIYWLIFPYPSGLLHWHCGNLTIAPVPAKQPWWIWINTSCEFIMNDCITTTKQSTTKPCAYFLGYTVFTVKLLYHTHTGSILCMHPTNNIWLYIVTQNDPCTQFVLCCGLLWVKWWPNYPYLLSYLSAIGEIIRVCQCQGSYPENTTLIPAWICNHIHYKVWDEITYPFLNFNGATVEV